MVYNETHFPNIDLREIFSKAVTKIFGSSKAFFDFLENEEYSNDYDCFLDGSGENYIIDTRTGEYINWYKLYHIGRCINLSILSEDECIPEWIENFLIKFKKKET